MDISELQTGQIVSAWTERLTRADYEDGIIEWIDYEANEVGVSLEGNRFRVLGPDDIEIPR